jgi:hypothetical protein
LCDRRRDDFMAFLSDMRPRPSPEHSLDRQDNDGEDPKRTLTLPGPSTRSGHGVEGAAAGGGFNGIRYLSRVSGAAGPQPS